MITAAMGGTDLYHDHPLYKLVLNLLKELKASGKARADIDVEILTYIMFGSIASTIMLGAQRKRDNVDTLAERFTHEWTQILQGGMFVQRARDADGKKPSRRPRLKSKAADLK